MTVSSQRMMLVFRNGQWCYLYHRDFFNEMLREHLKKIGHNEMSRKREELALRAHVDLGEVVTVNGHQFRYKHETHIKEAA